MLNKEFIPYFLFRHFLHKRLSIRNVCQKTKANIMIMTEENEENKKVNCAL